VSGHPVDDLMIQFIGSQVPGGCDDCEAHQEVESDLDHPGIWNVSTVHDITCPTYRRMVARDIETLRKAWNESKDNPVRRAEIAKHGLALAELLEKGKP